MSAARPEKPSLAPWRVPSTEDVQLCVTQVQLAPLRDMKHAAGVSLALQNLVNFFNAYAAGAWTVGPPPVTEDAPSERVA